VPNIKGVQAYMGVEAMCNTMMYWRLFTNE
jgi:hypothetical protein